MKKHGAFFADEAGSAMDSFDVFKAQVAALGPAETDAHALFPAENQAAP